MNSIRPTAVFCLFFLLQIITMPFIAYLYELKNRVGFFRLKRASSNIVSAKAVLTKVTITEEFDESYPAYRPDVSFVFIADMEKIHYKASGLKFVRVGTIQSAYESMSEILPAGHPFTFLSHQLKSEPSLFKRPILKNDKLSQFLDDKDHLFLKKSFWLENGNQIIQVNHAKGNYAQHQFQYEKPKGNAGFIVFSSIFFALFTVLILIGSAPFFPRNSSLSLSEYRITLCLYFLLLALLSSYVYFKVPVYKPSKNINFEFEVNAKTVKTLSP